MISHQFGHHPKFSWEFRELNQNDSYLSSFKIQDTKQTELQWQAPNHYRYEVGRSKPDRTGFFRKFSVLAALRLQTKAMFQELHRTTKQEKRCHERLE